METQIAPQVEIEKKMQEIVNHGNYEAVYLFSNEGLHLARAAEKIDNDQDRLAEISLLLNDVQRLANTLGSVERLKEVFMEGENHRRVIFRFFQAFDEQVVLVAVIPPQKAYRRHTNELQKIINNFFTIENDEIE